MSKYFNFESTYLKMDIKIGLHKHKFVWIQARVQCELTPVVGSKHNMSNHIALVNVLLPLELVRALNKLSNK